MKALAEQPSRMRRRAVIVGGQRSPSLLRHADITEIAAFGDIASERPPLQGHFLGARLERGLAAALAGKAIGTDMPAGKIIGGEFIDRQAGAMPRGEGVCRVVVLVGAFECRDPQRLGATGSDRPLDFRRGVIEMMTQPARRAVAKADRLQPDQRGGSPRLVAAAAQPLRVPPPLPRPQRLARRDPGRQIKDEEPGAGRPGARDGDAAGDDLVIGMRRQDQDTARLHQAAARAAAICHTGSRSSFNTSAQPGTRVST
jgi:hypothetical protein